VLSERVIERQLEVGEESLGPLRTHNPRQIRDEGEQCGEREQHHAPRADDVMTTRLFDALGLDILGARQAIDVPLAADRGIRNNDGMTAK
jgi:hypothetical protein